MLSFLVVLLLITYTLKREAKDERLYLDPDGAMASLSLGHMMYVTGGGAAWEKDVQTAF